MCKSFDPATVIMLADADALGVALLLELRNARTRATRRSLPGRLRAFASQKIAALKCRARRWF
jgi:hypothetical protein